MATTLGLERYQERDEITPIQVILNGKQLAEKSAAVRTYTQWMKQATEVMGTANAGDLLKMYGLMEEISGKVDESLYHKPNIHDQITYALAKINFIQQAGEYEVIQTKFGDVVEAELADFKDGKGEYSTLKKAAEVYDLNYMIGRSGFEETHWISDRNQLLEQIDPHLDKSNPDAYEKLTRKITRAFNTSFEHIDRSAKGDLQVNEAVHRLTGKKRNAGNLDDVGVGEDHEVSFDDLVESNFRSEKSEQGLWLADLVTTFGMGVVDLIEDDPENMGRLMRSWLVADENSQAESEAARKINECLAQDNGLWIDIKNIPSNRRNKVADNLRLAEAAFYEGVQRMYFRVREDGGSFQSVSLLRKDGQMVTVGFDLLMRAVGAWIDHKHTGEQEITLPNGDVINESLTTSELQAVFKRLIINEQPLAKVEMRVITADEKFVEKSKIEESRKPINLELPIERFDLPLGTPHRDELRGLLAYWKLGGEGIQSLSVGSNDGEMWLRFAVKSVKSGKMVTKSMPLKVFLKYVNGHHHGEQVCMSMFQQGKLTFEQFARSIHVNGVGLNGCRIEAPQPVDWTNEIVK